MKQFEDGDPCFAPMLNALFAAFRGTAVMDGCEASATGTSRAVSITAGSAQVNGVEVAVGAGSVTLDAGGAFDRYDLISVNAAGSKIVTKGVAKRKCPPQPANACLLAIVFVPAGATVVATGNVYDARMLASTVAVGQIVATRVRPVASDNVRWSKSGSVSVTIPQVYTQGTVKISMTVSGYWDGDWWYPRSGTLSIDGVAKKTISAEGAPNTHTGVYAVSGGSIVSFSGSGVGAVSISCSDTFPIIYPPAATWPS